MKAKKLSLLLGSAVGAAMALGHAGNLAIDHFAPTPEEFAAQNGLNFGKKATDALRAHSDLRVIETGSKLHTLYKVTHPIETISGAVGESHFENWASYSYGLPGLFGAKNLLFMAPKAKETYLPNSNLPQSNLEFSITLFHETGHHQEFKTRGDYALTLPMPMREASADVYTIESLADEFGGVAKQFIATRRALTIDYNDPDHDTLPALLNDNSPVMSASAEAKASYAEIRQVAEKCMEKTNPQTVRAALATVYDCLKPRQAEFTAAAKNDPVNMQRRGLEFIKAYEALPTMARLAYGS